MTWEFPVEVVRCDWEVDVARRGFEGLEEVGSCVLGISSVGVGLGGLWKRV